MAAFQYIRMTYKEEGERLLIKAYNDRTRENAFKLKYNRFKVDRRKNFFMVRMMGHWHRFCKDQVG